MSKNSLRRARLVAAVLAMGAAPAAAHAQASGEILLGADVEGSCGVGTPDYTELDLQDLTGPDGLLDPSKTGGTTLATATISDAWCNTAHSLTMQAFPMALEQSRPYAQPNYLARKVTFDARLSGWIVGLTDRPLGGGDSATIDVSAARAAAAPGLELKISNLETLSVGNQEQAGLMLEPGTYRGTVTITLAVAN